MSGGNRNYRDIYSKLRKTLCKKHKQQLQINFLARNHNVKNVLPKTFLACVFSASHYLMSSSGGQARHLEMTLYFCSQFSKTKSI